MKSFKRFLLLFAGLGLLNSGLKSNDLFYANDPGAQKSSNAQEGTHSYGLDQDRYVMMENADLRVHYRIIGNGPVDVVFIPGWTNPLTVYTKQFDYFRDKAR
ncbi:MAG: alpha/beta fold hydrolase, partial [Bacteroidales bacterium]